MDRTESHLVRRNDGSAKPDCHHQIPFQASNVASSKASRMRTRSPSPKRVNVPGLCKSSPRAQLDTSFYYLQALTPTSLMGPRVQVWNPSLRQGMQLLFGPLPLPTAFLQSGAQIKNSLHDVGLVNLGHWVRLRAWASKSEYES